VQVKLKSNQFSNIEASFASTAGGKKPSSLATASASSHKSAKPSSQQQHKPASGAGGVLGKRKA
jgi:hypothetical protein